MSACRRKWVAGEPCCFVCVNAPRSAQAPVRVIVRAAHALHCVVTNQCAGQGAQYDSCFCRSDGSSTGIFRSAGNAKATEAVTRLTQWIGQSCAAHGRVVKTGDGVLALFRTLSGAVTAVVRTQSTIRAHQSWPEALRMRHGWSVAAGGCNRKSMAIATAMPVSISLAPERRLRSADQIWASSARSSTRSRTPMCVIAAWDRSPFAASRAMPVYRISGKRKPRIPGRAVHARRVYL